jgi:choice-of-anchor A domain-containing protein
MTPAQFAAIVAALLAAAPSALATYRDTPKDWTDKFCGNWDQAGQCFGKFANGYNLFVSQHAKLYNSDVEGRVAVGGNVHLSSYSVGLKLGYSKCRDPFTVNSALVVAGGKITWSTGRPEGGNTVSTTYDVNGAAHNAIAANRCDIMKTTADDVNLLLNSVRSDVYALRNHLAGMPVNTQVEYKFNGVFVKCSSGVANHVVHLDGSKLLYSTYMMVSNCGNYQSMIINVSGAKAGFNNFGFPADVIASKTVFNFFAATELVLNGVGVKGHILAIDAAIYGGNGVVSRPLPLFFLVSFHGRNAEPYFV